MQTYLDIVKNVLDNGSWKSNRTGVRTLAMPNIMFSHNMADGFPLLTTKEMSLKTIAVELEGFIKGITDKRWYQQRGCHIWDEWCNPQQTPKELCFIDKNGQEKFQPLSGKNKLEWQKANPDLGPLGYSQGWRNFGGHYRPIPFADCQLSTEKDSLYYPYVLGIACLGDIDRAFLVFEQNVLSVLSDKEEKEIRQSFDDLQTYWEKLIYQCYDTSHAQYAYYGGRGMYVSNRWLVFENFIEDVVKLDGWLGCLTNGLRGYALVRSAGRNDFNPSNNAYCHGPKTCLWEYVGKMGDRETNACNRCYYTKGYDQLKNIVQTLKANPNDRRMVCSAWNPQLLDQMALPPCHVTWIVTVIDGKLNLAWIQRSCDLGLGVPYNIASYALLLLLLCKESGFKPGNLSGLLVDCHVYENHIPFLKDQLSRSPQPLPQVCIITPEVFATTGDDKQQSGVFDIFQWTHNNIYMDNYCSHPKIKMPIAV